MPLYDFECKKGHLTEHYLPGYQDKVMCGHEDCQEVGDHRPSFWYSSGTRFAQSFSPVVIHRDAAGNIRFPGHANAPIPPGFQKVELATVAQVRQFEKEVNAKDSAQADKFRAARSFYLDGQLKENRRAVDEIAAGGKWQGTDEQGRIIERHGLSERGKKILDHIRQASRAKQEQGRSHARPEFFVEAFTQDASNREYHRDQSTDWQRVRK